MLDRCIAFDKLFPGRRHVLVPRMGDYRPHHHRALYILSMPSPPHRDQFIACPRAATKAGALLLGRRFWARRTTKDSQLDLGP
jgi:hypothetical protein